jgi:hypothetical protein
MADDSATGATVDIKEFVLGPGKNDVAVPASFIPRCVRMVGRVLMLFGTAVAGERNDSIARYYVMPANHEVPADATYFDTVVCRLPNESALHVFVGGVNP